MRWIIALLLPATSWFTLSAQSFYSVSFRDGSASLPLYQGFSNDIKLDVIDPGDPCRRIPREIRAEGAQVEYSPESSFVKVLPKSSHITLQVYTSVEGRWLSVGKVSFSTIKPDVKETSFKLAMGTKKPQSELPDARTFSQGSDEMASGLEVWMIEPAIPTLMSAANQLKVYVADESRSDGCTPQKDIEIISEDAAVKKLGRNHFEVVPKEGSQRCTLEVRMEGLRISTETLQVKPR